MNDCVSATFTLAFSKLTLRLIEFVGIFVVNETQSRTSPRNTLWKTRLHNEVDHQVSLHKRILLVAVDEAGCRVCHLLSPYSLSWHLLDQLTLVIRESFIKSLSVCCFIPVCLRNNYPSLGWCDPRVAFGTRASRSITHFFRYEQSWPKKLITQPTMKTRKRERSKGVIFECVCVCVCVGMNWCVTTRWNGGLLCHTGVSDLISLPP